jgi:hypothetical protein
MQTFFMNRKCFVFSLLTAINSLIYGNSHAESIRYSDGSFIISNDQIWAPGYFGADYRNLVAAIASPDPSDGKIVVPALITFSCSKGWLIFQNVPLGKELQQSGGIDNSIANGVSPASVSGNPTVSAAFSIVVYRYEINLRKSVAVARSIVYKDHDGGGLFFDSDVADIKVDGRWYFQAAGRYAAANVTSGWYRAEILLLKPGADIRFDNYRWRLINFAPYNVNTSGTVIPHYYEVKNTSSSSWQRCD